MAGGSFLGLTRQKIVATCFGSEWISVGNSARPQTSEPLAAPPYIKIFDF